MQQLLKAMSALVSIVSSDRVAALATRISNLEASKGGSLSINAPSAQASDALKMLVEAWKASAMDGRTISVMLLASCDAYHFAESNQQVELVWTGPTTEQVPARRTEQALIQVIDAARQRLFITSYVAYEIESVARALKSAAERNVQIDFLVEMSNAQGGKVSTDPIANLRKIVPNASFYVWKNKAAAFVNGSVHAKVAVADRMLCFITSANLTGYAMDQNMEAGVLVSGKPLPDQVHRHLEALVFAGVVKPVGV